MVSFFLGQNINILLALHDPETYSNSLFLFQGLQATYVFQKIIFLAIEPMKIRELMLVPGESRTCLDFLDQDNFQFLLLTSDKLFNIVQ